MSEYVVSTLCKFFHGNEEAVWRPCARGRTVGEILHDAHEAANFLLYRCEEVLMAAHDSGEHLVRCSDATFDMNDPEAGYRLATPAETIDAAQYYCAQLIRAIEIPAQEFCKDVAEWPSGECFRNIEVAQPWLISQPAAVEAGGIYDKNFHLAVRELATQISNKCNRARKEMIEFGNSADAELAFAEYWPLLAAELVDIPKVNFRFLHTSIDIEIGRCFDAFANLAATTSNQSTTPSDGGHFALLRVFTNGATDRRIQEAELVRQNENMTLDAKLKAIDQLIKIPATASSQNLADAFGVRKQAVQNTDWWKTNRKGQKENEQGRRAAIHEERREQRQYE